ncbi:unnamed protein product [Clavelina lepadiformis]|uniref:Uncharacterized protein n=1 Tax=Clavelina lepadiformis TaxID=159417 RepID=A0ABP0EYI7_CLALP
MSSAVDSAKDETTQNEFLPSSLATSAAKNIPQEPEIAPKSNIRSSFMLRKKPFNSSS